MGKTITTEIQAMQQPIVTFFFFKIFLSKGKMILAPTLCFIALIPVMQGDSAVDGFSGILADEKPTANGDGESGTVKDVSNKTETKRVAALKELGRLQHNEAVAFLGERQDSPRRGRYRGYRKKSMGVASDMKRKRKEKNTENERENPSPAKRRWNMNGKIHSQRSKIKIVFPIELNFTHRNYEIVWRNLSKVT